MHLPPPILRMGIVSLIFWFAPFSAHATDDPVQVELIGGKRVSAELDGRTNQDRLWLSTSLRNGSLSQSISWEDVRRIQIAGRSFDSRVVRAAVATLRDASPTPPETVPSTANRIDGKTVRPGTWLEPNARTSESSPPSLPKVHAMTIWAWLENWDQDVNADGLIVELTTYDSYGNPIPCEGTVNFVLHAWKTSGRDRHLEIRPERWTRNIRLEESQSGTVRFRLPFRAIQPHTGSEWWPHGILQVRLVVPGSGIIERTLTDLRLRRAEPMRDTWELHTGHRDFSGENIRRHAWSPQ